MYSELLGLRPHWAVKLINPCPEDSFSLPLKALFKTLQRKTPFEINRLDKTKKDKELVLGWEPVWINFKSRHAYT